jgi:hypothetical protein
MRRTPSSTRSSRGSALVTVILVVLILTIVGVGIAYFTQMEDRLSGNTRVMRAAFYAADAGLRKGETVISALNSSSISLDAVLNYTGATPPLKPPGGGWDAVILKWTDPEDGNAKEFLDRPIPLNTLLPLLAGVVDKGSYSLYVRNNQEETDPLASPTADKDSIINLISVGQINAFGGSYTKIVEEQLLIGQTGTVGGGQKDVNAGGTGAGIKPKS